MPRWNQVGRALSSNVSRLGPASDDNECYWDQAAAKPIFSSANACPVANFTPAARGAWHDPREQGSWFRVFFGPRVAIRAGPSRTAKIVGCVDQGELVHADAVHEGWARLAADGLSPLTDDITGDREGWILIDGQSLGLGLLLEPYDPLAQLLPGELRNSPHPAEVALPRFETAKLVCLLASHLGCEERVIRFTETLASIARQEPQGPPSLFVSWSASTEALRRSTRALLWGARSRIPQLRVAEQGTPHSQFQHLQRCFVAAYPSEAAEEGRWVFFSDDDDLWHPSRYSEYLGTIKDVDTDDHCAAVASCTHAKLLRMVRSHAAQPEDVDRLLKDGMHSCIRTNAEDPENRSGEHLPEYWDFALRAKWFGHFLRNTIPEVLASKFCDRRLGSLCTMGFRRNLSSMDSVRWFIPKSWLYFYSRCDCIGVVKESTFLPYMGGASTSVRVTEADRELAEQDLETVRGSSGPDTHHRVLQLTLEEVAFLAAKLRACIEEQLITTCAMVVYAEEMKDLEQVAMENLWIGPLNQTADSDKELKNWALMMSRNVSKEVCRSLGVKVKDCTKSGPVSLDPEPQLRFGIPSLAVPREEEEEEEEEEAKAKRSSEDDNRPYFLIGSWSYWAEFTELKRIAASKAYSARASIMAFPGQEEFQIVRDRDWSSCFYCGPGGDVMGPRDGPGTNWVVDVPVGCDQIEVFWKPSGKRSVDVWLS